MRSPLDDKGLLVSLISGASAATEADRQKFTSQLGRLELAAGTISTLVTLPPGTQAYGPIVAGRSVAWVETSTVDLRAYGWKLHVTDTDTKADRVVASDPGLRPDGVTSVLPAIAFDGSTLLFTALAHRSGELVWELRRVRGEQQDVIADLARITSQQFTRVTSDAQSIAWIEAVAQPAPQSRLGIYDLARATLSRHQMDVSSVYQILLTERHVILATGFGVMETDRAVSYLPKRLAPEGSPVDQMAILGQYLLYRNFDVAQTLSALDLSSRAHAVLGRNVTSGPVYGNARVSWFERAGAAAGRVAIAKN